MTATELERREKRAEMEPLVIAKTQEGYRVHSPANPARVYLVTGDEEAPSCTCPDFQRYGSDPEWRCKHILAVLNRLPRTQETPRPSPDDPPMEGEGRMAQMLLRRSISPDGRIDSLSIEFSCPVEPVLAEQVMARAMHLVTLQDDVAREFLERHSIAEPATTAPNGPTPSPVSPPGPVPAGESGAPYPATILSVEGMDSRWGRRLFLSIDVDGRTMRFFGGSDQLNAALTAAGYANGRQRLTEGTVLNLPCQVVTRPSKDGRYRDIARILPPRASAPARRAKSCAPPF